MLRVVRLVHSPAFCAKMGTRAIKRTVCLFDRWSVYNRDADHDDCSVRHSVSLQRSRPLPTRAVKYFMLAFTNGKRHEGLVLWRHEHGTRC